MMRLLCLTMGAVGLLTSMALADILYFKDGRVLEGEITHRGPQYIILRDQRGIPAKYPMELIDYVYGKEEQEAEKALSIDPSEIQDVEEEKVRLITEFIKVSGVYQNMRASIQKIIEKAPQERQWEIEELFDLNALIQNLIPIYDQYYTQQELKELISFYTSPVGQKFLDVTPKIMAEALQNSVIYFQEKINE